MTAHFSTDLFENLDVPVPFEMTDMEAEESIRRARNAMLQKPISHLDSSREAFTYEGVYLFERINPVQVAQEFLSIVCNSMLMHDGIECVEAEERLAAFIGKLDQKHVSLSDRHRQVAAKRVIEAILNKRNDYKTFEEQINDPRSGEQKTYRFWLVLVERRIDHDDADVVYRLTEDGAKLLLIMLNAPEQIDMMNLIISTSIQRGEFDQALRQLTFQFTQTTQILARLKDINRRLGRLQYDRDFDDELDGLLKKTDQEIDRSQDDERLYRDAVARSLQSEELSAANRETLGSLRKKLDEMREAHAKLRSEAHHVSQAYIKDQERKISASGEPTLAPDLINDFLKPIVMEEIDYLTSHKMGDRITSVIYPPNPPAFFDPFVFYQQSIIKAEEDAAAEAVEEEVEILSDDDSYKSTELDAFYQQVLATVFSRDQGVSLSEISNAVKRDPRLTERQRRGIVHTAALFNSDKGDDAHQVRKEWNGDMIDNEYVSGEDVRLIPVRAQA